MAHSTPHISQTHFTDPGFSGPGSPHTPPPAGHGPRTPLPWPTSHLTFHRLISQILDFLAQARHTRRRPRATGRGHCCHGPLHTPHFTPRHSDATCHGPRATRAQAAPHPILHRLNSTHPGFRDRDPTHHATARASKPTGPGPRCTNRPTACAFSRHISHSSLQGSATRTAVHSPQIAGPGPLAPAHSPCTADAGPGPSARRPRGTAPTPAPQPRAGSARTWNPTRQALHPTRQALRGVPRHRLSVHTLPQSPRTARVLHALHISCGHLVYRIQIAHPTPAKGL